MTKWDDRFKLSDYLPLELVEKIGFKWAQWKIIGDCCVLKVSKYAHGKLEEYRRINKNLNYEHMEDLEQMHILNYVFTHTQEEIDYHELMFKLDHRL